MLSMGKGYDGVLISWRKMKIKRKPWIIKIDIIQLIIFLYITSLYSIYGQYRIVVELGCISVLILNGVKNKLPVSFFEKNFYFVWGMLFIFYSCLSIVFGENCKSSLYGTRGIVECFLCGVVISCYINSYDSLINIFKYMLLSSYYLFVKVLVTVPYEAIVSRNFSDTLNANSIGMRFAISCLVLLWLYLQRLIKFKYFVISYTVFIIGTLFSGSRKALFIFVCGSILILILRAKNSTDLITFAIISIAIIYICYYIIMNNALFYEMIGKRVGGLVNVFIYGKSRGDASTRERIYLISVALDYWKRKPIFGYGINSFGEIIKYSNYGQVNVYSHCNYVELLFGVGILGTILYYSLHCWMIIKSIRLIRKNYYIQLLISIIASLLFIDIGLVSYGDEFIQFIMMILSNILFWSHNEKKLS